MIRKLYRGRVALSIRKMVYVRFDQGRNLGRMVDHRLWAILLYQRLCHNPHNDRNSLETNLKAQPRHLDRDGDAATSEKQPELYRPFEHSAKGDLDSCYFQFPSDSIKPQLPRYVLIMLSGNQLNMFAPELDHNYRLPLVITVRIHFQQFVQGILSIPPFQLFLPLS